MTLSKVFVKFSRPKAVGLSISKNGMGDSKYDKLMAELKASVECPVCLNVPTDGSHMLTCPRLSLFHTSFLFWVFSMTLATCLPAPGCLSFIYSFQLHPDPSQRPPGLQHLQGKDDHRGAGAVPSVQGADGEQQELVGDGGVEEHGAQLHERGLQGEVGLRRGGQAQGGVV